MSRELLWRLVEHRKRRWIVIIVTAAISLLLVLPAVDNYSAEGSRFKILQADLARTQASVDQIGRYEKSLEEREAQLAQLDGQVFNPDAVEAYRNELVTLVRDMGCQMRRIRVGDPTLQMEFASRPGDGKDKEAKKNPASYDVYGQPLSLQVTGSLPRVIELLKRIHAREGLIQTQFFSLKKSEESPELTNLDLDLLLIDLRIARGKTS